MSFPSLATLAVPGSDALSSEGTPPPIVVTHEMGFAREVADRVLFMNEGYIEEEGSPDEIFQHPKSERLQQFFKSIL